jgi:glycine/D-amino acid oxidase-like deaminating enzyme
VLFADGDDKAGVIGLQTALILKEAGFDVVIVAKDFPGSEDPLYTSTW